MICCADKPCPRGARNRPSASANTLRRWHGRKSQWQAQRMDAAFLAQSGDVRQKDTRKGMILRSFGHYTRFTAAAQYAALYTAWGGLSVLRRPPCGTLPFHAEGTGQCRMFACPGTSAGSVCAVSSPARPPKAQQSKQSQYLKRFRLDKALRVWYSYPRSLRSEHLWIAEAE